MVLTPAFDGGLRFAAEAPNTPAVITSGTTNCTADTPRLPRPAFMPSA
jgi:hypothetical protein